MSQNLYSYITSGKSSSSLHRDSTSLPTPQLTLNGKPINPPSSAAYPPKVRSRRGSRSSTHMAGTSSSSNVSSSRAGNDARPTSSSSAATERPAMNQRKSSGAVKAAIKATPNPFLHPAAALEYITWRIWLWFSGNLSLGMLTDTEVILLTIFVTILGSIIAWSLFFHLPNHLKTVIARATYYIYGSGYGEAGGRSSAL